MAFLFLFDRPKGNGGNGSDGWDLLIMIIALVVVFGVLQCTGRIHMHV